MALQTTSIDLQTVKNTIGETDSDLVNICKSSLNNWWGFDKTYGRDDSWGEQPDEYVLGDYRNYDHTHRCYALEDVDDPQIVPVFNEQGELQPEIDIGGDFDEGMKFTIKQRYFPSWSINGLEKPEYTVEFKRTNDFHVGGFGIVESSFSIPSGEKSFSVDCNYPPDNSAAPLVPESEAYIRVKVNHGDFSENLYDERQETITNFTEGVDYGKIFKIYVPKLVVTEWRLTTVGSDSVYAYEGNNEYVAAWIKTVRLERYKDGVLSQPSTEETASLTMRFSVVFEGNESGVETETFTVSTNSDTNIGIVGNYPKLSGTSVGERITIKFKSTYYSKGDDDVIDLSSSTEIEALAPF